MPRYHFDVLDKNTFIDAEGVDFADAATMRRHAMRAAGSMVGEITDFPSEPWMMIIRDARRDAVATLAFSARSA